MINPPISCLQSQKTATTTSLSSCERICDTAHNALTLQNSGTAGSGLEKYKHSFKQKLAELVKLCSYYAVSSSKLTWRERGGNPVKWRCLGIKQHREPLHRIPVWLLIHNFALLLCFLNFNLTKMPACSLALFISINCSNEDCNVIN